MTKEEEVTKGGQRGLRSWAANEGDRQIDKQMSSYKLNFNILGRGGGAER